MKLRARGSRRCILCACVLFSAARAPAEVDWQPDHTWVFAVGILQWRHPDEWPSMTGAKANRRDVKLVDHFRKAGVADERIVYLQDQAATRKQIESSLTAHLSKTRPGDMFVLYFTGHGFRDHTSGQVHFANYDAVDGDSAWSVRSIFETLETHFRGKRVLLLADCCFSGGLADEARRHRGKLACACLCSAFSHNGSTGAWTFTDTLLAGFGGDKLVDIDDDGHVALDELAHYAELEMAFSERQKSVFAATNQFPPKLKLADAKGQRRPRVGERLEAEWRGSWYRAKIIDVKGQKCKIHYVGDANSWDEWVGSDRLRPFKPPAYAVGKKVQVRWGGDHKWYPGTIRKSWYGLHLVHYDKDSAEWDEWVGPDAIKVRK